MSSFNVKDDWKYIAWKATMITNLYRSIGAGIMLSILMLIFKDPSMTISKVLLMPLVVPVAYFCIFLPVGLVCSTLSRMGIPYIGLVAVVCSIGVVIGDPLVWIFNKATNGEYVPVKHFDVFNFAIILFVIDEERKYAAAATTA